MTMQCSLLLITRIVGAMLISVGPIINGKKTKEMILHFSKRFDKGTIPSLVLDDSIIGRVEEFKLLGVVIRSDLSWCTHVKYMIAKAS